MKNIGLILTFIGAVMLIVPTVVPSCSTFVDYNAYTITAAGLVLVGIIAHIILNKILPLDGDEKKSTTSKSAAMANEN